MKSRPNICRLEQQNTSGTWSLGWQVRITRARKTITKYFSDNQNGGAKRALGRAERFRNRHLRMLDA